MNWNVDFEQRKSLDSLKLSKSQEYIIVGPFKYFKDCEEQKLFHENHFMSWNR